MGHNDSHWLCEFTLGGETHHVMSLLGSSLRSSIEEAIGRLIDAHNLQYPHLPMKTVRLVKMDSIEQADRFIAEVKAKRKPNQLGAEELYPENPNALLFQPLDGGHDPGGQNEAALLQFLCDGRF